MLKRLLQTLLIAALVYAGAEVWREFVKPPPNPLRMLADAPLRELFGPDVVYDLPFQFDLDRGAEIRNLRVPNTSGLLVPDGQGGMQPVPGFQARRVRVTHDPVALAAGRYRPMTVELEGAVVYTHETESGIAPDFPLHVRSDDDDAGSAVPNIYVRNVTLHFRALPDSERLRPNATLQVHIEHIDITPDADRRLIVDGRMLTLGLGQDQTAITLKGTIEPDGKDYDLEARWDPVELTDELLAVLPAKIGDPLAKSGIRSGTFVLRLQPKKGAAEGEIDPTIHWDSEVELKSMRDLPGLDAIDARTRDQLIGLFGDAAVHVEMGGGKLNIKSLVTEMAGGRVHASGWVIQETGAFAFDFTIHDLRLEDEAVRNALGDEAETYDEFDPRGVVDAFGRVTGSAEGEVEWSVDVLLQNADLRYVGAPGPDGKRLGFPYWVREATGKVHIDKTGVTFDDIVGFNRGAEILIRGNHRKSWTGGETGRLTFTEDGAGLKLTIIATNIPMDEELRDAIRNSEFADMLEEYEIEGVIDRIELDLVKDPKIERQVKAELRLTLEGEQFRYLPFPMPLEDVRGQLTMLRPLLEDGKTRGRVYKFDVTGWAEGAPLHAWANIVEHESRGRLHVQAEGMPLAGKLAEAVQASETTRDEVGSVWRWLEPRGKADVHVDIPLADDPDRLRLDAKLLGASIRLDAENESPLEITNLTGDLHVADGVVTLTALSGSLAGAPVEISGTMAGGLDGEWALDSTITGFRLTPSIQGSLEALLSGDPLLPGGMSFETGSRLTLDLTIRKAGGEDAPLDIAFQASELDTVLQLPDGSSLTLTGEHLGVDKGVVTVRDLKAVGEGLTAEIRRARIVPDGETALSGRFHAVFDDFVVTDGLLDLLPETSAEFLREWTDNRTLRSKSLLVDVPEKGPITLEGDLALVAPSEGPVGDGAHGRLAFRPLIISSGSHEGVVLTGLVQLGGFSIDAGIELADLRGAIEIEHLQLGGDKPEGRGRIVGVSGSFADLSVERLSAPVDWKDDILRLPAISGLVCGGELVGDFVMHTSEPIAYEGNVRVDRFSVAQLRDDLAPSGPNYEGIGNARFTFQNRGGEARDLTGAGTLTIRKGRLGDLPFIANIFTLTDELADVDSRPQFERADLVFTLKDEVFTFRRFDLAGPLFDLPGSGTLDMTGVVDLRFTPDLVKGLVLPGVMQMPGLGPLLRGVVPERFLYAVRVRGPVDSAESEVVFLPGLGLDRGRTLEGAGARSLPRRRLPGLFR